MKISLNWLRELCPTDLSVEELSRKLTFAGFEVEATYVRPDLAVFVARKPGDVVTTW